MIFMERLSKRLVLHLHLLPDWLNFQAPRESHHFLPVFSYSKELCLLSLHVNLLASAFIKEHLFWVFIWEEGLESISDDAQGLILTLFPGITPSTAQRTIFLPAIEFRPVICKVSVLLTVLSLTLASEGALVMSITHNNLQDIIRQQYVKFIFWGIGMWKLYVCTCTSPLLGAYIQS